MRIYGPYVRKTGRRYMNIIHSDGRKTTKSYARFLMEQHLGRQLTDEEIVHHKDGDKTNDSLENFEVISQSNHARIHRPEIEIYSLVCVECGIRFEREARFERHYRRQGKTGPFCGKSCAGTWSRRQQMAG